MKVLAVSSNKGDPAPHISDEMRRIAELQGAGVIEQLYLKADRSGAVIMLETESGEEAERQLATLPLVQHGGDELRGDRARAGTLNQAPSGDRRNAGRRGASWQTPRMAVDVVTEVEIRRPREEVSAFATDPGNATAWYRNITKVEWETAPTVVVGSRVRFRARFLGRTLEYTYEVQEYEPGRRFVMSTSQGPFPMETTYTWEDTADGATRMTLRNRGEPAGFAAVAAPVMTRAMRRANEADLRRLRELLER